MATAPPPARQRFNPRGRAAALPTSYTTTGDTTPDDRARPFGLFLQSATARRSHGPDRSARTSSRSVGVRGPWLGWIGHQEAEFFGQGVHPRPCREIIRCLPAAVQHHDEGHRGAGLRSDGGSLSGRFRAGAASSRSAFVVARTFAEAARFAALAIARLKSLDICTLSGGRDQHRKRSAETLRRPQRTTSGGRRRLSRSVHRERPRPGSSFCRGNPVRGADARGAAAGRRLLRRRRGRACGGWPRSGAADAPWRHGTLGPARV